MSTAAPGPGSPAPAEPESTATTAHTTVEQVVREQLLRALGGWRGTAEAAVPIVAFLAVFALRDDLTEALLAAGAVMGVLVVVRLAQGQTLQHVFSGVLGLAIAAALALRTGEASDVFLPGIIYNAVLAVGFAASMLLGWPVVGFLFGAVTGDLTGWRARPGVRLLFQKLTAVLLANYVIRVVVQLPLYLAGSVYVLGTAKIVLGWPLLAVSVVVIGALLAAGRTPLQEDDADLSKSRADDRVEPA